MWAQGLVLQHGFHSFQFQYTDRFNYVFLWHSLVNCGIRCFFKDDKPPWWRPRQNRPKRCFRFVMVPVLKCRVFHSPNKILLIYHLTANYSPAAVRLVHMMVNKRQMGSNVLLESRRRQKVTVAF